MAFGGMIGSHGEIEMEQRGKRSRRIGGWGERASWQFGTDRLGQANRVWVWIGVTEDRPQS